MVQLTKFLGFYPENNFDDQHTGFDIRNGQFNKSSTLHRDYFDRDSSNLLVKLLGCSFTELPQISVNQKLRTKFLLDILDYYNIHIHGFGTVKSMAVLQEIFRDENET
jgi:DNA repair protein RecO (recombination protein O)